jgi:hypothetical protein
MDYYTKTAVIAAVGAAEKIFGNVPAAPLGSTHRVREMDPPPGVVLENYKNEVASEDGKYIVIKEHSEWVQGIPQPRSEAEIRADAETYKERMRRLSQIALGVGLGVLGVAGIVVVRNGGIVRNVPVIVPVETPSD